MAGRCVCSVSPSCRPPVDSYPQEKIILDELNETLEQQKQFEITQFLDTISSEIKTPMNPILSFTEMLNEEEFGSLGQVKKKKLKTIDNDSRNIVQLITNLSGHQKFSIGKHDLKLTKVDIKKIIHEAHLFFASQLDAHGMQINSTFSKPLWIMCDTSLLFQVFANLLQLAFYTIPKKSGKIIVNVWDKGHEAQITFSHNETTISSSILKKVFSTTFEINPSTVKSHEGIPLGLSHCKQIIESHGGKIWYDDKNNDFSSIIFTLPNTKSQS